jgi:DNA-binding LytR/AlgR family response regulator
MRIAICDDNSQERIMIKRMIKSIPLTKNIAVSDFENGTELLNAHSINHYNIIFMDVDMPDRTGIEIGKQLRKNDANTILIFITSYPQYAIEAYDCDAFHYLLKPLEKSKFEQVLNKAVHKITILNAKIMLNTQNGIHAIPVQDICYVECLRHKLIYYTVHGNYTVRDSLSNALEVLLPYGFCQTHQGFIANLSKIQRITTNEAILVNGMSVMISVRRQKEVEQIFTNYLERTL